MTVMHSVRIFRLALSLAALLCTLASAQDKPPFTSPLPTGVKLDPAGEAVDLGSMPINLVLAPEADKAVVVLSGWREQGVQVIDLKTRKVTQTLLQDGAFYGAAFSPDGHHLCVSGGNTDMVFVYAWKNGTATLENKSVLAMAKTADGTGTSYPAGLAFSPNGKFVYVAENVGDRLAVMNAATGEIAQRFLTDHYPYGVALTQNNQVFVSAWGSSTISQFRILADGRLAYIGRIEVGRHPSAMAVNGSNLYITLAGSDRVAVIDTKLRKLSRYLHDAAPGSPPEGSTPNAVAFSSDGIASVRRRSRQQCRRRLRCGQWQLARAHFDRLVSHRDCRKQYRAADRLRQRARHSCQPRRPSAAYELAGRKPHGIYARPIEWLASHASSITFAAAISSVQREGRGCE